jgi:hypothetical protein
VDVKRFQKVGLDQVLKVPFLGGQPWLEPLKFTIRNTEQGHNNLPFKIDPFDHSALLTRVTR